jgi:hypothetical protein
VRNAWDDCQGRRERDAIYLYLTRFRSRGLVVG